MTRARIWITERPGSLLIKGRGAARLLREAGKTPYFVGTVQAYMLHPDHLADLCAFLDYRNVPFEVTTHRPSGAA